MSFKQKTVFFDIDNTILDNVSHSVPDSVSEALRILKGCGCRLCLATGRGIGSIPQMVLDYYEWDGYVTANGQYLYNGKKELIYRENLPKEIAEQCLKIADRTQTTLECKTERGNFILNFYSSDYYKMYERFKLKLCSIDTLRDDDKIIALMAVREHGNYDDFAAVDGVEVYPFAEGYADINVKGASKYQGILRLLQYMGAEGYAAFGDADNDYEMLKHADISIAMGNAPERIREISSFVTAKAGEDGILHAVKHIEKMA